MDKKLHIVSFDVPLPANYGGVIDVFYKLKALHAAGIKIILHCFVYGKRAVNAELEKYCEEVNYYGRLTGMQGLSLLRPYIVNSRKSEQLLKTLLINDAPILFEGLHTCYFLNHPSLAGRKKYVRAHNIEHEYYTALAKAETSRYKKMYFSAEAKLLRQYEEVLKSATAVLPISERDTAYFAQKFSAKMVPAFHENSEVNIKIGCGEYCLYQGNLAVAENRQAVEYLIENVFSKLEIPIKIGGANPSLELKNSISDYKNIELIENPTDEQMQDVMRNAQVHVLYSAEQSGLKLKLLNSLFQGRFVVANSNILVNEKLLHCANCASTPRDYIQLIHEIWGQKFSEEMIAKRNQLLQTDFSNERNAEALIEIIFS